MPPVEKNDTVNGLPSTLAPHAMGSSPLQSENPYLELAIVEAEVENVSSTLSGLIRKLHFLKERINELYSPFVRLLPPEVVSEVFMFCLPKFEPTEESPSTEEISTPLKLGAVCSSWRRIAWSTPSVWSILTFHLTSSMKIPIQTVLLEEWLSRSGQLPLSIRLTSSEEVSWVGVSSEGMMKAIRQYAARWRDLDIRLPSVCYKFLPPSDEAENFPLLHSLTLKPPGGQGDRIHKVNIPQSPQLRYLALSCLYLRSIVFHFEVLTHIDLESFYVDEILEMLRQTVALVNLMARKVLGGDDRHTLPEEPILLPCLEEIIIINDKGTELQVLLDKISAPKLRTLSYTGESLLATPSAEIVALVKRSGCYLDTLSISKAPIREEPLQLLLAALPSLTVLTLVMPILTTLRHAPLTDTVLQTLDPEWARANKVNCSLPELKSLTYSGAQGFTWATMLHVLESRCPMPEPKGSSQSQSVHITPSRHAVSCIKNVWLSLTFMTPEENLAYPRPDPSAFESLESRGAIITSETIIQTEATIDPQE